ncbi:MAG TPA: hypothetical protein DCM05_09690 [Elusimicrobia bacterium]|nr:hypothetical protein [Elusimicrobiota bacterium]
MTKALKTLSAVTALFLFASPCSAGPSIESLKAAAADLGISLDQAAPVPAFQGQVVRQPLRKGEESPFGDRAPFDAFRSQTQCSVLDSKFFIQPSLGNVLSLLKPCLESLSRAYGVEVAAGQGLMKDEREGLFITVGGPIPEGNPVVGDLRRSIESRGGVLLSVPAQVLVLYER